jgi:hypothetical protein
VSATSAVERAPSRPVVRLCARCGRRLQLRSRRADVTGVEGTAQAPAGWVPPRGHGVDDWHIRIDTRYHHEAAGSGARGKQREGTRPIEGLVDQTNTFSSAQASGPW